MIKKAEILAPVGGQKQLEAAVRSGADAVYLGTKSMNARAGAQNFDEEELLRAVCYCHARGVKVHVTLNTLVNDSELEMAHAQIETIANSGADAVIVQDLGVAKLVRECCPSIEMHASTQMTIHNLSGAIKAKELGFSRVVLARELELCEIELIAKNCGIETEVFIHGALCVSMSGACYMSSMLGERSGNRGRCAGPCRLNFTSCEREHALSLKDMSHIKYISDLVEAGVSSIKIEGRLKGPEYVAAAVNACVLARDGLPYDIAALRDVFSRSGFTDGYITGKRTTDMFGFRTDSDKEASRETQSEMCELYRLERRSVGISMRLTLACGTEAQLIVSDGKNTVSVRGLLPEKAQTRGTDEALAQRNLEKTGGTPFFLEKLELVNTDELFLPASSLNSMRKEALERLLEIREKPVPHEFFPFYEEMLPKPKMREKADASMRVHARFAAQLDGIDGAEQYILPMSEIEKNPDCIKKYSDRLVCEIPQLVFPMDEEKVRERLRELARLGLKNALVQNIGAIEFAESAGLCIFGGHGLNIMNSLALEEYEKMGAEDVTASFELSQDRIRRLGARVPVGVIAGGCLPLMIFRNCPARNAGGCMSDDGMGCSIVDRKGTEFKLRCREKKFSELLNPIPMYMSDKNFSGVDFTTLYFTAESPKECADMYRNYSVHGAPPEVHTNGLYFRELL